MVANNGKRVFLWVFIGFLAGFLSGAAFVIWREAPQVSFPGLAGSPGLPPAPDPAQVAQVIDILENDIKANPENPQPLLDMGGFLIDQERFREAAEYFQRALDLAGPQSGALSDLGYCLREMGRPEEALNMFDRAIDLDSGQKSAYYNAGIVALYDLKDKKRALHYFEAYLKLDPPQDSQVMVERLIAPLRSELAAAGPSASRPGDGRPPKEAAQPEELDNIK